MSDAPAERLVHHAVLLGRVAEKVDHRVNIDAIHPPPPRVGAFLGGAVGEYPLHACPPEARVGVLRALSARDDGDLVAVDHEAWHEVAADVPGAADDEDAHDVFQKDETLTRTG